MSKVVLDASAILAVLHREPGGEVVAPPASGALVPAVYVAEARAPRAGGDPRDGGRPLSGPGDHRPHRTAGAPEPPATNGGLGRSSQGVGRV